MMRSAVVLLALAMALEAEAAAYLPIERSAALSAIKDAAGRNGDDLTLHLMQCGSDGDNCRYDAGGGVEFMASGLGTSKVYQLDASWSNQRSESSARSRSIYIALCKAVVATVRPGWDRDKIAKQAAKLAILHPIKGDHLDFEDRQTDVIFYGSRNIPDQPDFPTAAFVQCGATANAENP